MLPTLPESAVVLGARARDWEQAVRLAGAALAASGAARPEYADDMVRMIREHGPYVVIAPGLALAHSRPGPSVLTDGLAVVTLADGVHFGHPYNDPVDVVVGLATATTVGHLEAVAAVANVFNDPGAVQRLRSARDAREASAVFAGGPPR